ncbi:hypothetical protein [Streptomyces griseofuscus]|uniref:hypothetical protein n=1 Tax=Streptomyces griseofuscus TaxID=146922 RepID=UPI0033E60D01
MTHGGAAAEEAPGVRPAAGAKRGRGRFSWSRRHPWLASAMALAVVAGGVAVPLALGGAGPSCRQLPAATRESAGNPAAATKALDPRDDMSGFPAPRALLPTGRLCGDGRRVLGTVVAEATGTAAAGTTATGTEHTPGQARAVWAVVVGYGGAEVPPGAEPGRARMLAGYTADTTRASAVSLDAKSPAVPARSATATDETGRSRFGAFLSPTAWNASPTRAPTPATSPGRCRRGGRTPRPGESTATWTTSPAASAACCAPGRAPPAPDTSTSPPTTGPYDGTPRVAPTRLTTRPPMGGIAGRPVSGPVRGDLRDGREQLSRTLDAWAKARKVAAARAAAMRQILDDGYIWAFRSGST